MKKTSFLSFCAAMAVFFMGIPAHANSYLTVFDGDECGYAPLETSYLDEQGTRTQTIFPANALSEMSNESINSITFYANEPITVDGGTINVLIGETAYTNFLSTGYIEGLTQVATISMTSGVSEVVITFDTPYLYHGGNLVLETYVAEATECCFVPFIGIRPTEYTMITRGEIGRFIPKATFDYGTSAEYAAKVTPDVLTFNTIRAEREDVQTFTLKNIGQQGFTPSFSVAAPFHVEQPNALILAGESLEVPVTFAPTAKGDYNGTLYIDCGQAGILEVSLQGSAIEAGTDLVVCDSTEYGSFVPIYGADIDIVNTQGQMIYPAEMLSDMAGGNILALTFHTYKKIEMNGGTIQMSLKIVDETEFTTTVMATGTTAVATASPVYGDTTLTFYFDEPYAYNGGNLLVDCLITEAGATNYRQTFFYGVPTEYNSGIYKSLWYGNTFDIELVPFLAKATFTYQKSSSSGMRGDVNGDGDTNISDAIALINAILNDNWDGINMANADVDYSESIDISDVTKLINFLLSGNWPE